MEAAILTNSRINAKKKKKKKIFFKFLFFKIF